MDATTINRRLLAYGKTPNREPIWRLVWSDDQRELRTGRFNEFSGAIFLRTVHDTREVPKYPFIKGRWILEKWIPPNVAFTPELPNSREGSYEPMYVFEDAKHNKLPLRWDVCEICIQHANAPSKSKMLRESEDQAAAEKKRVAEQKYDEDALEISPMTNALHMREGVGYTKEIRHVKI